MTTVGFVGLGRMGAGMAARLIGHADEVLVYDVSADAVQALVAQGAKAAGSLREVGEKCDIVFASLPTPPIVREAVLGADGLASGGKMRVFVDLGTSGPRLSQELAEALGAKGVKAYDAPVSGGVKPAREGTLSLMAGGPQDGWDEVAGYLARFGKAFYMGETPGAGQSMKLVNNLLGAGAIALTSEGMALGIKAGLDPARMIEVLNVSTGINSATRDKWPRSVLPRTFDFGFAAALSLKDMKLGADEAEGLGAPFTFGKEIIKLLERTLEAEGPQADFTAMAKTVERDAGLDPERPA